MTDQTDVLSVYAELLARAPENKMEPRMEPMWRAMELLGDPQNAYPSIHITGTNGKTSTARIIEAGLRAHNLRTGRYTSPHLTSVTERISVDGEPVSDEDFVRVWDEIRPFVAMVDEELTARGEPRLTYFEALTVLAFAVFADQPVDVAVVEVGLGGITDATNVVSGAVSVVTPIGLDHTDLLGDTVRDIALEKSGILKPGGFLVSAAQEKEAADVLLERARELGIPFRFEGVEFGVESRELAVGGQVLTIQGLAGRYPDLHLPLHGEHQAENAAVAVAALEAFLGGGERELGREALEQAFEAVTSPGRLDVVRTDPTVILDAAHNPDGIRTTTRALKEAFSFSRLVPVVGILAEKDAAEFLSVFRRELDDAAGALVLTASTSPRAIPAAELEELALAAGWSEEDIHVTEGLVEALRVAGALAEEPGDSAGGILVTGSITLVGEAQTLLAKEDSHGA
ncbi:folylpolyglutamate synthase/dihydrofolate synthase family protein [Falsarthrobacter nasiphocae]|uniref:tetrahydrofolate synthase n=1 Tax=Falsarthrobacter nasiphocae TaxID=189863 RepID=A0AAE4C638_9MICC|nr:folylpolyglutamate synthase/dihydrofolate synthase family protein [Falsarthrobacter nasiphocae]MDR6892926.1 dihydrofolate synthase/folylpolyglutamate synthase [Falsarthrobacter nasiphocae]